MVICSAIRGAVDCDLFDKNFKILIRSVTLIPICFYVGRPFMDFDLRNILSSNEVVRNALSLSSPVLTVEKPHFVQTV
jgi:hypothetical protein